MSKHKNICLREKNSTPQTTLPANDKAVSRKLLSWETVANLLNRLPMGVCECETEEDAKGYIKVLIILLAAFIIAGIGEGGAL